MKDDSAKKKLLTIAALVVAVCVLAFLVIFSRLNTGGGQEPEQPVTAFPASEDEVVVEPQEEVVLVPEPVVEPSVVTNDPLEEDTVYQWESEVNEFSRPSLNENQPIIRVEDESPFSIDDLSHLNLGPEPAAESTFVPPPTAPPTVITPSVIIPTILEEEPVEYPDLGNKRFSDCGDITIPTGFGVAFFSVSAGSNPTVVCLGEAVASSGCGSDSATILSSGEEVGSVYVTKRPGDNVCSVGTLLDEGLLSLCSVEKLMDIGTGEDKSMSQWRSDFSDDPGGMFADMYFNNTEAFGDLSALDTYDCELYSM